MARLSSLPLLFCYFSVVKKIPELMKGIGKGVKNFKDGVKGLEDDIKIDDTDKK